MGPHSEDQAGVQPEKANPLEGFDPMALLRQGAMASQTGPELKGMFDPPSPEIMAELFPRFEIIRLIGRGGMGAVYEVRQRELDRIVALKILPPEIGGRPGFSERFTREARALAKLNHPGIVTLHEFGQVNGLYFILMEYVDGANLRDLLEHGSISPTEALAIVPQICEALQYAHNHGIIHRDIKPENILLDRAGRVKVADFGLAKLAQQATDEVTEETDALGGSYFTELGKVMGTPSYMAPEQKNSPADVDHRADIYALGVVFYQMLTGELPEKSLVAPSTKVRIDVRLDEVVLRALQENPELRFQQASMMKTEVEGLGSASVSAVYVTPWRIDYRSKAKWFGLPLLHVAWGPDSVTEKKRGAKGIIAIGGRAKGLLAIGGAASGGIAIGGVATGVIALGGLATGVLAFGGVALGLVGAAGIVAAGGIAIGGGSIGYYSSGEAAYGMYAKGSSENDPAARAFFGSWEKLLTDQFPWLFAVVGVILFAVGLLPGLIRDVCHRSAAERDLNRAHPIWGILALALVCCLFAGPRFLHEKAENSEERALVGESEPEDAAMAAVGLTSISSDSRYIDLMLEQAELNAIYQPGHAGLQEFSRRLERFSKEHPGLPTKSVSQLANERKVVLLDAIARLMREYGPDHPELPAAYRRLKVLEEIGKAGGKVGEEEVNHTILPADLPAGNRMEIRHVVEGRPDWIKMKLEGRTGSGGIHHQELEVAPDIIVSGLNVRNVKIPESQPGVVEIELDDVGRARIAAATKGADGTRRLAVMIDGRVWSAPVVMAQLGGNLSIMGLDDPVTMKDLLKSFPIMHERMEHAKEARLWLGKIDSMDWESCYEDVSPLARKSVEVEQWKTAMRTFRQPLGGLVMRIPARFEPRKVLPGMPEGEYGIWQFDSKFTNKANAVETVLMSKENGVWKPLGYYIR